MAKTTKIDNYLISNRIVIYSKNEGKSEDFMNFTRKITLFLLAGLILGLFGGYLMAMEQKQLPTVTLNQASICGQCGENFEVNQQGTKLYPCGHIIHEKCLPQVFYYEKQCTICEQECDYFKKTDFLFVQPSVIDRLIDRSQISLDLDPLILARALVRTNQNRQKQIRTDIKEFNAVMNAFNKLSKVTSEQIIESYHLRDQVTLGVSAAVGLIGMAAAYKFLPNPSLFKSVIPSCLASAASYFIGNSWNQKLFDAAIKKERVIGEELDKSLKALRTSSVSSSSGNLK